MTRLYSDLPARLFTSSLRRLLVLGSLALLTAAACGDTVDGEDTGTDCACDAGAPCDAGACLPACTSDADCPGACVEGVCMPDVGECGPGHSDTDAGCVDDDECLGEGSGHDCDPNATCTNTVGSYTCSCDAGYTGDGTVCTPAPDGAGAPELTNFRVEDGQPNRLYFDSSEAINASTGDGFVVSGNTIASMTVSPGGVLGHYFTVSSDFTYWDNTTIRYEGGSDIADADGTGVYPFTLRYVVNEISEPEAPVVRYAAATSAGAGDGTSEADSWSYAEAGANATAGMTVYMKAGRTNRSLVIANSGTASAPIRFIGYRAAAGDIPSLEREIDLTFSDAEMPLFIGDGGGTAIQGARRDYVIVKNVQVENWNLGIDFEDADKAVLDNVYVKDITLRGITAGDSSTGSRITNSYVADCGRQGIWVFNVNNMVSDSWVVSSRVVDMDYHISVEGGANGGNNIIRNNLIHVFADDTHGQHAIALKAGAVDNRVEYNLVENCTIVNSDGGLEFRHSGTRHSVARNIVAYRDAARIAAGGTGALCTFQNGTSYNTLENSTGHHLTRAIKFVEGLEDGTATQSPGDDNRIVNTMVYASESALFVYTLADRLPSIAPQNNEFLNCTFHDNDALATVLGTDSWDDTNRFVNSSFSEIRSRNGSSGAFDPLFEYSNFHESYGVEPGDGNASVDPAFVDTVEFVPTNSAMKAGTRIDGVAYDREGVERDSPPTIGAVEIVVRSLP